MPLLTIETVTAGMEDAPSGVGPASQARATRQARHAAAAAEAFGCYPSRIRVNGKSSMPPGSRATRRESRQAQGLPAGCLPVSSQAFCLPRLWGEGRAPPSPAGEAATRPDFAGGRLQRPLPTATGRSLPTPTA